MKLVRYVGAETRCAIAANGFAQVSDEVPERDRHGRAQEWYAISRLPRFSFTTDALPRDRAMFTSAL
jgi:hypothetical protein